MIVKCPGPEAPANHVGDSCDRGIIWGRKGFSGAAAGSAACSCEPSARACARALPKAGNCAVCAAVLQLASRSKNTAEAVLRTTAVAQEPWRRGAKGHGHDRAASGRRGRCASGASGARYAPTRAHETRGGLAAPLRLRQPRAIHGEAAQRGARAIKSKALNMAPANAPMRARVGGWCGWLLLLLLQCSTHEFCWGGGAANVVLDLLQVCPPSRSFPALLRGRALRGGRPSAAPAPGGVTPSRPGRSQSIRTTRRARGYRTPSA